MWAWVIWVRSLTTALALIKLLWVAKVWGKLFYKKVRLKEKEVKGILRQHEMYLQGN